MIESHNEIKECCILMLEDTNFAIRCLGLIEKKIVIMIQSNKIPLFFPLLIIIVIWVVKDAQVLPLLFK